MTRFPYRRTTHLLHPSASPVIPYTAEDDVAIYRLVNQRIDDLLTRRTRRYQPFTPSPPLTTSTLPLPLPPSKAPVFVSIPLTPPKRSRPLSSPPHRAPVPPHDIWPLPPHSFQLPSPPSPRRQAGLGTATPQKRPPLSTHSTAPHPSPSPASPASPLKPAAPLTPPSLPLPAQDRREVSIQYYYHLYAQRVVPPDEVDHLQAALRRWDVDDSLSFSSPERDEEELQSLRPSQRRHQPLLSSRPPNPPPLSDAPLDSQVPLDFERDNSPDPVTSHLAAKTAQEESRIAALHSRLSSSHQHRRHLQREERQRQYLERLSRTRQLHSSLMKRSQVEWEGRIQADEAKEAEEEADRLDLRHLAIEQNKAAELTRQAKEETVVRLAEARRMEAVARREAEEAALQAVREEEAKWRVRREEEERKRAKVRSDRLEQKRKEEEWRMESEHREREKAWKALRDQRVKAKEAREEVERRREEERLEGAEERENRDEERAEKLRRERARGEEEQMARRMAKEEEEGKSRQRLDEEREAEWQRKVTAIEEEQKRRAEARREKEEEEEKRILRLLEGFGEVQDTLGGRSEEDEQRIHSREVEVTVEKGKKVETEEIKQSAGLKREQKEEEKAVTSRQREEEKPQKVEEAQLPHQGVTQLSPPISLLNTTPGSPVSTPATAAPEEARARSSIPSHHAISLSLGSELTSPIVEAILSLPPSAPPALVPTRRGKPTSLLFSAGLPADIPTAHDESESVYQPSVRSLSRRPVSVIALKDREEEDLFDTTEDIDVDELFA